MRFGWVSLAAAAVLLSACGTTPNGLAARSMGHGATAASAVRHGAAPVLGLRDVYPIAAKAALAYGDDFQPMLAHADAAFDRTGQPLPTTWRFAMVGHLRGARADAYSWFKLAVGPDGKPLPVDPQRAGPFADVNSYHTQPAVDPLAGITPEAGMAVVMADNARKNPPGFPVSVDFQFSERLGQAAMEFDWATADGGKPANYCDSSLDPATGAVIENDVSDRLRAPKAKRTR